MTWRILEDTKPLLAAGIYAAQMLEFIGTSGEVIQWQWDMTVVVMTGK
jgi:hypothetical protein